MMTLINTQIPQFNLHFGTPTDAALIVEFMQKLGAFQNMADQITVTQKRIEHLLKSKMGEVVFGVYDRETVAFAYYYQKSSAFTGQSGLFIDSFFIDDSVRGKGLGNIMMQFLSKIALERGCEMLEWGCLDWNTSAIEFYKNIGGYCVDTMRIYRLSPDDLKATAIRF